MSIDLSNKLKTAMRNQNITQNDLAKLLDVGQSNISMKLSANNFKLNDYEKMVLACGCELEVNIILPNGQKI